MKASIVLLIAALAAMAQTPAAPLAFEVATIKPAEQITPAMVQGGKMHVAIQVDAARVDIGYDLLYTRSNRWAGLDLCAALRHLTKTAARSHERR